MEWSARPMWIVIVVTILAGVPALAGGQPRADARSATPVEGAGPAQAKEPAAPPATYSLTIRLTPMALWNAASDLARRLNTSGVFDLADVTALAGAMSAEVAVEKGAAPGASSSQDADRMSSSAWSGREQSGPSGVASQRQSADRTSATDARAAITVDTNRVRDVATSFAEWHAAALRSGCDALASGQVQQTLATITQQLQWVTGSTGTVGTSLSRLRTLLDQSRDTTRPDPAACAGLEASLRRTISQAEALSR